MDQSGCATNAYGLRQADDAARLRVEVDTVTHKRRAQNKIATSLGHPEMSQPLRMCHPPVYQACARNAEFLTQSAKRVWPSCAPSSGTRERSLSSAPQ